MNGQIAALIQSRSASDQQIVRDVFRSKFRDIRSFRNFLKSTLQTNVTSMLHAPSGRWDIKSFHALYIACWVHHPLEKGSYMIDLSQLSEEQRGVIQRACDRHLARRKSSHLGGAGRSAKKGWAFLKGYRELLVQMETTKGTEYLFMKAEDYGTGLRGFIPHTRGYFHMRKTGHGLTASAALNTLASAGNPLVTVEGRAAENYANGYKAQLRDVLKLRGTKITVRDMLPALYQHARYPRPGNLANMSNREIGDSLISFCRHVCMQRGRGTQPGTSIPKGMSEITPEMISDLQKLAKTLKADGDAQLNRVFREIRVAPAVVDSSLKTFYELHG
ncbi:hypothetical protein [Fuerstiella marisgermanici]|uniref:Uncharacterized protein n=1 Tax=Fuerstiella marisgermanici TaxID=1891926 RepID=A0A1P8W995_9PLAN|nr:hypothetical protein [Fuerstiella marisgermanici]APZ90634.1 hypothetical protein Fuma_00215 [Fuerstiella marisgermanici]